MKIKSITKLLFYKLIFLIEISIIVGVFIINHLTTTKGGVMRHIYSKRLEYEQTIYSKDLLEKQSISAILFAVLFTILLIYAIKNHKSILLKLELIAGIAISLSLPLVINFDFFINMMSYPYFIMACEIVILIQFLIVIILLWKEFSSKDK